MKIFNVRLEDNLLDTDQAAVNAFMEGNKIEKTSTQFVPSEPDYWSIVIFYTPEKKQAAPKSYSVDETDYTPEQIGIINALKAWRKDRAEEIHQPEFTILHNSAIVAIAQLRPTTLHTLSKIQGVGSQKVVRFGEDILSILNAF